MNLDDLFAQHEDWKIVADAVVMPPTWQEIISEFADVDNDVVKRAHQGVLFNGLTVTRGCLYLKARRSGESDRLASSCALQEFPQPVTTDTFWAGRKPFYEVYGEDYANDVRKKLKAQGTNLLPGQEYMPELARFKGDPEAVVPFGGGRSYIKSLCEQRGWAAEGAVNVKHQQPDDDPLADENCVPMADNLVRREASRMVQENPDLARMDRRELREKVIAEHGPSKDSLRT